MRPIKGDYNTFGKLKNTKRTLLLKMHVVGLQGAHSVYFITNSSLTVFFFFLSSITNIVMF